MEQKTKTAEEWRVILEDQKQRKLTDQVCADEHGVSVWTLRKKKETTVCKSGDTYKNHRSSVFCHRKREFEDCPDQRYPT